MAKSRADALSAVDAQPIYSPIAGPASGARKSSPPITAKVAGFLAENLG
jgi:hypothetical protein